MIRLVRSLALTSLLLSLPVSASALGISISNVTSSTGTQTIFVGDTITVDLVLENATGESVNGLGLVATGYDEDPTALLTPVSRSRAARLPVRRSTTLVSPERRTWPSAASAISAPPVARLSSGSSTTSTLRNSARPSSRLLHSALRRATVVMMSVSVAATRATATCTSA